MNKIAVQLFALLIMSLRQLFYVACGRQLRRGRLLLKTSIIFCIFSLSLSLSAEIPRPEHPRPDAFRKNWLNLNGIWQFEIDDADTGVARGLQSGENLDSKIVVPFCPESKLSWVNHYGIMKHLWYRRTFQLPKRMSGQRILLHFGAVYYSADVFVNGAPAGSHTGGSESFDFEITRLLRAGKNEIVVHVFDDVASGSQPAGKQTPTVSHGCLYTRTSGIWQTVWLEAVGSSFVENASVVPDPDNSTVQIDATVNGLETNLTLTATAFAGHDRAGSESCAAAPGNNHLVLHLSEKHLWQPGKPYLYDLRFTLTRGDKKVDEMASYFGLRKVSIQGHAILINGKPVFQRLILDQGFYPEGIWTAPSDADLKNDIKNSMAAGFNGARLHQKVFEPRYLYWADKLGYLVWGEFPSWGFDFRPKYYSNFTNEWREAVLRDRNHPAIVGWCPFNESPRVKNGTVSALQQIVWNQTRGIDPTRPIIESSGWVHTVPDPEVLDAHDYDQNPDKFRKKWGPFSTGVPFMVSEFGGIGWATQGGWGYGNGPRTLNEFYARYQGLVDALLDSPNLFGFCYTQLTDVE
ncbi:MAG TPA: glycoside hydrolase family 2 TIM barrel-domain containing protein [Verrucomicrobiae bacterium]